MIVSRDENGEIHVLINRCAHRGPTVCQQEYGNANFFRCEYHGWVYGNDGSLAGVSLRRGFGPGEIDDIQGGLDQAQVGDLPRPDLRPPPPGGPSLSDHLGLAKQYLDDWMDRSATGEVEVQDGIWKHAYEATGSSSSRAATRATTRTSCTRSARLVAEHVQLAGRQRAPALPARWRLRQLDRAGVDLGNGHSVMGSGGAPSTTPGQGAYAAAVRRRHDRRHGEERAAQVLGIGWRMQLFPNVCFANNQIRVIRPIARSTRRNSSSTTSCCRAPPTRMRTAGGQAATRISTARPATAAPDDFEMLSRMFEGYRSSDFRSSTSGRASPAAALETARPERRALRPTSTEVEQRANYYAWAALMKGDSHVINKDPVSGTATQQAALSVANRLGGGANQG